jgi:Ca2+-binding EF-hand superfamily protein
MNKLSLSFLLLALAGPAAAQTARFDADGDGRITRREFIDGRDLRFTRLDNNGDGVIRADDFRRFETSERVRQRLAQLLSDGDLNDDGAVSRAEFSLTGTPLFDRADANADGYVDRTEVAALRAALEPPRP